MAQINNTVTPGLVSPFGTPTALNSFTSNLGTNTTSNYPATVTSAPTNAFAGSMQTSTPQIAGLVNPVAHPAVAAAANSHPTSLTTNPDGTVKATYNTSAPIVSTPSTSNPTSNPNYNYNAGVASTGTGAGTPVTSNAGTSTPSTGASPTTQQGLLSQIQTLINQQNAQQSGLTSQEQGLISNFTNMNAGILSQPGEIGYQTGRQAQLQQTENTGLAALEGEQTRLAGYEQPQISALTNAAGLLTPTPTAPGQAVFNPATGTYTNASSGGATPQAAPSGIDQNSWNQYIQDFSSGNFGAIPSSITGNANLSGQLQQAVQAQNPNFNYNTAVGSAQGQQALGAAGGTGAASVLQSIPALQSANTAAQGIANTLSGFLQQNPQINSSPLAVGNLAQQWLQGKQLADPTYQTFFNYLSEYANTLAPVLGVGGDPTNMKTQIAQAFLNAQASGQSTMQVLQAMGNLATTKIANLQSGATGGGVVNPAPSNSGSIYDF